MSTDLTVPVEQSTEIATDMDLLMNPDACNHLMKMSEIYSKTDIVPAHFRGKPNDLFVTGVMARRLGVDWFLMLQKCYVIQGKVGFETQFALALLAKSGKIKGPITYLMGKVDGKFTCTASVIDAATGETISHTLSMKTVEAEGWAGRPGSKWKTDPGLMLRYRSAIRLIRTHYPQVLLGAYTDEELMEMNTVEVTPRTRRTNVVPDEMLGSIMDEQPALEAPKRKPGRPRKEEAPAPPMDVVPADADLGGEIPSDAEFDAMCGLLAEAVKACGTEDEVSSLERAYVRRAENPDETLFEKRLDRILAICDARRGEIA